MKRILMLLALLALALGLAACGTVQSGRPADSAAAESEPPAYEPGPNDRLIRAVPMYVTLPEGFNAYDPEGNYTDEMCAAQGVEPGNMAAYLSLAKKDLMLVPADEQCSDRSLEIYIRVKSDNDYGIDSFAALSEAEFQQAADALAASFAAGGFQVFGSDTYETANARFCVIDCKAINYERRYATVVNGKMIYVVAVTADDGVTDEQDALVRGLLDSMHFV